MPCKPVYKKELIASLLLAVMCWVYAIKLFHTHEFSAHQHDKHAGKLFIENDSHHPCNICEFQLARDAHFTGTITFEIRPVSVAQAYCRLLTSLHADHFFHRDTRGPPQVS